MSCARLWLFLALLVPTLGCADETGGNDTSVSGGGVDSSDPQPGTGGNDAGAVTSSGTDGPSTSTTSGANSSESGGETEDADTSTSGGPTPPPVDYACTAEIHIAPDGDDANPGTEDAPRLDIANAVGTAAPGDCFLVHAGTYSVSAPIAFTDTPGTEDMPIVLWSVDGPLEAVLDSSAHTFGPALLITTDHIIIDGFDFINMPLDVGEQTIAIRGLGEGRGVGTVLRRNRLTGGHNHLKVNERATGLTIEYNEFHGAFGHIPISLTGIVESRFTDNYMHDWTTGDNGAVQIKGGSSEVVFERNVWEHVDGLGGALALGDGCDTCDIDPDHYAGVELVAANNVFVDVGRAFDLYGCRDCAVLNNTIVSAGTDTVVMKFGAATTGGVTRNTTGARVLDNLITNPLGDMWALVQFNPGSTEGLQFDYNLVWNGGSLIPLGDSYPAGADTHGVQADPQFVADGYALAGGSPAVDVALPLPEVAYDHTGAPRPLGAGPDIGAFESH